ncbi:hypothetical protein E1B28_007057 [Marasmius oreades]|uniref:CCR4-Not complex component Not N-terminal domain-containing protein n=1 Tax=Marasmius oreades TaxID=181124 RepID=A0A9P7UT17_9AGAR|nr:uncharacterized protein E1B28_007057 [Marasmius oreades]KAG7093377.1 hypothetical protein E1B28_007057 [Marasmius oreades]
MAQGFIPAGAAAPPFGSPWLFESSWDFALEMQHIFDPVTPSSTKEWVGASSFGGGKNAVGLSTLITERIRELEMEVCLGGNDKGCGPFRVKRKDNGIKESPKRSQHAKNASSERNSDDTNQRISSVVLPSIKNSETRLRSPSIPSFASTPPPTSQPVSKPRFETPIHLDETLGRLYGLHELCKASYTPFELPVTFTNTMKKRRELYSTFTSHAQELRELHHSFQGLLARTDTKIKSQSQRFGEWLATSKNIQSLLKIERHLAKTKSSRSLDEWYEFGGKDGREVAWLPSSLEELQLQIQLVNIELKKKKMDAVTRLSLRESNMRRKWHVGRLEIVMGLLLVQDSVPLDMIEQLGRRVVCFVENNMAEGFQEERGIYDDILRFDDDNWDEDSDCDENSPQETDRDDGLCDALTDDKTDISSSSPQHSPPPTSIQPDIHNFDTSISGNRTFSHNNVTNTDTTDSHNTNSETNTNSHNVYNNITNHHHHNHHHHHRQERRKSRWNITKFVHQHIYLPILWNPYSCLCSHHQTMASSWLHAYLTWLASSFGSCHR